MGLGFVVVCGGGNYRLGARMVGGGEIRVIFRGWLGCRIASHDSEICEDEPGGTQAGPEKRRVKVKFSLYGYGQGP